MGSRHWLCCIIEQSIEIDGSCSEHHKWRNHYKTKAILETWSAGFCLLAKMVNWFGVVIIAHVKSALLPPVRGSGGSEDRGIGVSVNRVLVDLLLGWDVLLIYRFLPLQQWSCWRGTDALPLCQVYWCRGTDVCPCSSEADEGVPMPPCQFTV